MTRSVNSARLQWFRYSSRDSSDFHTVAVDLIIKIDAVFNLALKCLNRYVAQTVPTIMSLNCLRVLGSQSDCSIVPAGQNPLWIIARHWAD